MINIEIIKHSNISKDIINEIISIKNEHWIYSYEQQLDWLDKNILENDYHLLIRDSNANLVAYLNMINLILTLERGVNIQFIGIGNVCTTITHKNQNLGNLLLSSSAYYLKRNSYPSCLFCKESLTGFYLKNGWKLFKGDVYFDNIKIEEFFLFKDFELNVHDSIKINRVF